MHGTEAQQRFARSVDADDWTEAELREAAEGFTLDEYEAKREDAALDTMLRRVSACLVL